MEKSRVRKPAMLGLGLAATLAASLVGCGENTTDNAVLVPEPNASVTTAPAASGTAAPAAPAAGGSTAAAPAAAAPVKAEGWGTLKGKITFNGEPPKPKVLAEKGKASKDPEVCAKDAPIMDERLVVDSGSKGVRDVIVYLVKPTAVNDDAKKAALESKPVFDQKGCAYTPHSLAVMVQTPVEVKSSDPTNHNVNFQLKNLQSNPLLPPGAKMEIKPTDPERIPGPVVCSIHSWMHANWMVLDHPYFAVTDAQGNFEIKNAPAGTQKVVVWQEAVGFVTPGSGDAVNIQANGETTKDFTIEASKVRPAG